MQNIAFLQRDALKERHYIRKADPAQRYWFDFSSSKLSSYKDRYGESFSLVIVGNTDSVHDYYAIPFPEVSHVFSDPFLSTDGDGTKRRWVGAIDDHLLKITKFPGRIDIKQYKGISLVDIDNIVAQSVAVSFQGHTRESVVSTRVDQAVFRQRVSENFDFVCALSGVAEQELLVASHIIPWSVRSDVRLDPSNGILLYAEHDALFDKGFITFDADLKVVISNLGKNCSSTLRQRLLELDNKQLRFPKIIPISKDYLKWHRENKFIQNRINAQG